MQYEGTAGVQLESSEFQSCMVFGVDIREGCKPEEIQRTLEKQRKTMGGQWVAESNPALSMSVVTSLGK